MFTDAIELAVAIAGLGLVIMAIRQAGAKGWAGSLQMAAGGFLLMGAAAIGIVGFVVGLVFSPLAWLGVASLAAAAGLFAVGQRLEGRSAPEAVTERGAKPKGQVTQAPKAKGKAKGGKAAASDPELDDIEAILRKHGIE